MIRTRSPVVSRASRSSHSRPQRTLITFHPAPRTNAPAPGLVHDPGEVPGGVPGQQVVPLPAPEDLDHVPAGADEERLQLLDDLPVAADRTVEPPQAAVDPGGEGGEPGG